MDKLTSLANPLKFLDNDVRTAFDDYNEAWFCARDVCQILDITWSGATLENVKKDWQAMLKLNTPSSENGRGGGDQITKFISIGGVFYLIMRSNKPNVIEFQHWVCGEVLPSVWKTEGYGKLSSKDYIAVIKQIADLTARLTTSNNAFTRKLLLKPLQNLCNMAGHPMPELALLSRQLDQLDLFDGEDDAQRK